MVLHSSHRFHASEPFVTLSLSGTHASKLFGIAIGATRPMTEITKPVAIDAEKSLKRSLKHDQSPTMQSSTPLRQRKGGLQHISSPKIARSKIITLKYRKSTNKASANRNEHFDCPSTPTGRDKDSAGFGIDGSIETISVDQSRRASTSSLTDKSTRSSRRARKLTSKAQALAGTKFYASVHSTSDTGSTVDPAEGIGEGLLDEGDEVQLSGTITPTPIPVDHPVAETPVPSVETTSVRSSTRERKPTARAVELEAEKVSRKRTRSPASVDRASKAARLSNSASKKLSGLRYSIPILPDTPPPDSDDTNTELEKLRDVTDTTASETSQIVSQPVNLDDTVSIQSATKPKSITEEHGMGPKSPPPTDDQSQDDPACDLTCLSPSFRLLALAKIASEWSDLDDSDEDAEDDDELLESADTSTADGDLALAKMRQLYCRCAQAQSNLNHSARENESNLQRNSIPQTTQTTNSKLVKAIDSKASMNNDITTRPVRSTTKPKACFRASGTSKTLPAPKVYDSLTLDKRQSQRSSTRIQPVAAEQQNTSRFPSALMDATDRSFQIEAPVADTIVPRQTHDGLLKDQDAVTLGHNGPKADMIQAVGDSELKETVNWAPVSSDLRSTKTMSNTKGKSKPTKSGRGSAGGAIRVLLQNNQEREQHVAYDHGAAAEPLQAGSIKLRFTNGSK